MIRALSFSTHPVTWCLRPFRPTLDPLEGRALMDVGIGHAMMPTLATPRQEPASRLRLSRENSPAKPQAAGGVVSDNS